MIHAPARPLDGRPAARGRSRVAGRSSALQGLAETGLLDEALEQPCAAPRAVEDLA